jgi:predicted PurR-regulated permease PerM
MFLLDDNTGNVVTTVALFLVAGTVLYVARGAFFILLLSVLFAYLLEPVIGWIRQHSRLGPKNRTWAIAQVYLIGTLVLGSLGYSFGPHLTAQLKNLNAAVPGILEDFSGGGATASLGSVDGVSMAQQTQVRELIGRHHDFITGAFERGATATAYVAASSLRLFAIPILAIFILRDGRQMPDAVFADVGPQGNHTPVKRILRRVDVMLAKYVRAQVVLSSLSFAF